MVRYLSPKLLTFKCYQAVTAIVRGRDQNVLFWFCVYSGHLPMMFTSIWTIEIFGFFSVNDLWRLYTDINIRVMYEHFWRFVAHKDHLRVRLFANIIILFTKSYNFMQNCKKESMSIKCWVACSVCCPSLNHLSSMRSKLVIILLPSPNMSTVYCVDHIFFFSEDDGHFITVTFCNLVYSNWHFVWATVKCSPSYN